MYKFARLFIAVFCAVFVAYAQDAGKSAAAAPAGEAPAAAKGAPAKAAPAINAATIPRKPAFSLANGLLKPIHFAKKGRFS